MAAILQIDIITDSSKATAGLDKIATSAGKVPGSLDKTSTSLGKLGKAAGLAAGTAAIGGLVAIFKTGAGEQSDFLAGQAQLENGIKTTGNAANTSVAQLEDLASSIQNYSGQTDDSIVASEKLLLTFTNLTNGVGEGNQVFDDATKMTADMAAKMGGDASKYAVQLGKALNDPTKGISALTKVGVTFTEAQKKQIKSMQDAGDMAGAQKVILQELQKEFGGSAEAAGNTLPGQLTRAKRSFEDVSQSVVAGLMPILTMLANILTNNIMPAFSAVMGFISEHQTLFLILAGVIGTVVAALKVWSVVQGILNAVMAANPIVLIVIAIAAFVAAIVIAYNKVAWFRDLVNGAFGVIKTVIGAVMGFITQVIPQTFAAAVAFVTGLPGRLAAAGKGIWDWISARWQAIWKTVTTAIGAAVTWVTGLPGKLAAAGKSAWDWLGTMFATAWTAVTTAIGTAIGWVGSIPTKLATAAGDVWGWLGSQFSDAWTTVQGAFGTALTWIEGIPAAIGSALSGLFGIITQPFKDAWDWINNYVISPIKSVWNSVASTINGIQFSVSIPSWVPVVGGKTWTLGLPHVPLLDSGGYVTKATMAVIGERRPEIVAAEPVLRKIIRDELGSGGGVQITVNGAIDGPSVARQIRAILDAQDRRTGGVRQVRGAAATA